MSILSPLLKYDKTWLKTKVNIQGIFRRNVQKSKLEIQNRIREIILMNQVQDCKYGKKSLIWA